MMAEGLDLSVLSQLFTQENLFTLGAILFLIGLSGFFSGSETALTATSRARMHKLEMDGNKRAGLVNVLINHRERLIGAILLGNNLVNILASALATSLFLGLFGNAGVAIATLVMTVIVLIFAEVLPKTYAIMNPDRMAMIVAPAVQVAVILFAPIVHGVQLIVHSTLRLAGMRVDQNTKILSSHEELRGAIDLHHQEDGLVREDRDMLEGLLDLRELELAEIMIHRKNMTMIDGGQAPEVIVEEALKAPHTRLPMWKDNQENIIGILHAKDLLRELGQVGWDATKLDFKSFLVEPWFVPDTTTLQTQLRAFLKKRTHFALVVDEYGTLMGLVTLEDIIEEIVGEIADEHDLPFTGVRPQDDGAFHVDGTVTVRDLNRELDWNLPEDEAITIAGLVIHEAQMIPEPGQTFVFYDFKFEILRRQRNQITAIRMTPPGDTRKVSSSDG